MAAAAVECPIEGTISSSSVPPGASQDEPESPTPSKMASKQAAEDKSSPEKQSAKKADNSAASSSAEESDPEKSPQKSTQDPPAGSQPGTTSPHQTPTQGGAGAGSDSDDEPVSRSRPRARRLALDSDEEAENADRPPTPQDGGGDDSDGADAAVTSPAPIRARVRRPAVESDSDSDNDGGDEVKTDGAAKATEKEKEPTAKAAKARIESEDEDSEDAERKRKEKNMKKLMALGDSSSEDERPAEERRPQTPTTGQDEEDQSENVKSGSKKKPQKKKGERRKVEQAAAEQMREIRSAAQRRTRESRLNLPYHRPRQRTLHEFLARRQKAPALPDHPRITGAEADYITRRLEEKEKEIEEFYKSESDHEKDGPGSDPEWKPEGAPTPAAAAGPCAAAATTNATAPAAPATPVAPANATAQEKGKEEEEEDKVMSQSSQKVQEWLEGVQPGSDGTGTPPMMDTGEEAHAEREKTGTKAEAEAGLETEMETETETGGVEVKKTVDANTVEMADQTEAGTSGEAAAKTLEPESTTAAALEQHATEPDESRSVSADTETTSLAPGDSASEVNARIATSAAPAAVTTTTATSPSPAAAAAAPPAARLARLAARLPQLGAVLGATPRLQKQSEVITLDDSDDESKQEPSDLDKFVERFVRHSKAKPKKKAEKKTVNISLVRYESDSAGGQQLVADSVPVTINTAETGDADDGPPGAQRQQLQRVLKDSIRRKREEARQRREREYKLYNSEQVDDGYLDDLPDEEAEPSDVSSESGESEPEEEPPLTETPRKRCPLVDDEAEQEEEGDGDDGEEDGEKNKDTEDDGEMRLVLEDDDDDEDLLDSPPRRASVITEPELFSTQPGAGHGDAASQADSQDSLDRASSSLVTAHQPGGGFQFGGSRQRAAEEPHAGAEGIPLTPALNTQTGGEALPETQPTEAETQPVDTELETQPIDGTGSFSLALESEDIPLPPAVASADSDLPDSLSQLGPLRLTPDHRTAAAGRGARSAIAALLDPAADESMDDLMSLCSGKFDAPGTGKMAKVTRADTQPVDLLSVPAPNNKDGVWTAGANTQKRTQHNSSEPMSGMSMMSTVDIFEDGNANMPLDIVSDDDDKSNSQLVRSKKRRRRLVFSDDEGSGGADEPFEHASASEDDQDGEDSGEDSVQAARQEDSLLPTDFTGFLGGGDKKKMREFFEAEAELSGSDEPSEDEEDGEDLDRMEEEEADAEQIDEEQLREQVERIHQKKALDEDIRDLKLFQERFLEDGDLHGKGRERKFRWSNADDGADDTGERRPSDDEADAVEEERDEQWRLERHEREKWLQEHAQKQGQDEDEGDSGGFTFLKPGQKVVRRLVSTVMRTASTETAAAPAAPAPVAPARAAGLPPALPASPRAVKLVSRGSFLRRGKEALARLVTTARSLSMPAGTSSKNSTNRTFSVGKRQQQQSESEPIPEIEEQFQQTVAEKTTKRKTPSTPAVDAKRAKLSRSFSSLAEDSQSNSLFSVIL